MFRINFPFSFTLITPGISNPFLASHDNQAPQPDKTAREQEPNQLRRRAPSPSLTSLVPPSRKRGWVPSSSELSQPTPMHTSTNGYLDTPAKYRNMATAAHDHDDFGEITAGACFFGLCSLWILFLLLRLVDPGRVDHVWQR